MNPKRIRSTNWDEEEKLLLRSVLKDYVHIIEDKSLNTNKNKTKAWEEVHKKFNGLNCRQRELGQLKIQWKGMKVNARKTYGSYRRETVKTGGGARPPTPDDSIIHVKDLLNPAELLRDDNPSDSDGLVFEPNDAKAATDVVSFDEVSQENEQACNFVITVEDVDIHVDAQKTTLGNPEDDLIMVTPLRTNMGKITKKKNSEDDLGTENIAKSTANKVPRRKLNH